MEAVLIGKTVLGALGAMQQGQQAQAAANYNAQIQEQNAAVSRAEAGERESEVRRRSAMVLGSQRAAVAQAGGGSGGSAADIMQQSAVSAELDALTTRYEGEMRARGFEQEAASHRYSGEVAASRASSQAFASILGGVGDYMGYQEQKTWRSETMKNRRSAVPIGRGVMDY